MLLQSLGMSDIKKLAMNQAPEKQPAPLKRTELPKVMEQTSQPQADKKMTARQSARMQKQQQQKQACFQPQVATAFEAVLVFG